MHTPSFFGFQGHTRCELSVQARVPVCPSPARHAGFSGAALEVAKTSIWHPMPKFEPSGTETSKVIGRSMKIVDLNLEDADNDDQPCGEVPVT
jgi:hypothetical protein